MGFPMQRFGGILSFIEGGVLNVTRLAEALTFEALHDTSLKMFLVTQVYPRAELALFELVKLTREFFVGERSETHLKQLRSDQCLGFTQEEERVIVETMKTPLATELDVANAVKYPYVRFVDNALFRALGDGAINFQNMISVVTFEAQLPGTDLKRYLRREVFFNHGEIGVDEISEFGRKLFCEEGARNYLMQLRRADRTGYTSEEEAAIKELINTPHMSAANVAIAMGYPKAAIR